MADGGQQLKPENLSFYAAISHFKHHGGCKKKKNHCCNPTPWPIFDNTDHCCYTFLHSWLRGRTIKILRGGGD